jgi:hypothetical protein
MSAAKIFRATQHKRQKGKRTEKKSPKYHMQRTQTPLQKFRNDVVGLAHRKTRDKPSNSHEITPLDLSDHITYGIEKLAASQV